MKKVNILGVNVVSAARTELNEIVRTFSKGDKKKTILYVNIHGMNLSHKYKWLKDFFNRSDLVICDGTGVLWGSKLLGTKIEERVALTDWGWDLAEIFRDAGSTLFLLGNTDNVIKKASSGLKSHFPGLKISGSQNGYFNMNSDENTKIIEKINSSAADVLFVGMGMPRQEEWILDNIEKLEVMMIISCGAMFNYWAGESKRCPKWVSRSGFEWFHRLLHEPGKLFHRYFPGNFIFFLRIFKKKFLG